MTATAIRRPVLDVDRCTNPRHDHYETVDALENGGGTYADVDVIDRDGEPVLPFRCHDCTAPAYYDVDVDLYFHVDPMASCFLIPGRPATSTPCALVDRRQAIADAIIGEIAGILSEPSDEVRALLVDDADVAFDDRIRRGLTRGFDILATATVAAALEAD